MGKGAADTLKRVGWGIAAALYIWVTWSSWLAALPLLIGWVLLVVLLTALIMGGQNALRRLRGH